MELTTEQILDAWGHEETPTDPDETAEVTEDIDETDEVDEADEADEVEETGEAEELAEEEVDAEEQDDPFREERERLEEQGRQAQTAALDAQAASLNLKDPYTGKIITTHAELLAFQARSREEKLKQVAKAAGLSEEDLKALIDQHPDVAAGRELRAQMEAQQTAQAQRSAERALMADIAAIGELMPEITGKEAVVGHESWPKVRTLMQKNPNLGLKDAWTLANMDAIQTASGKKAQTTAKRNAQGKSHLRGAAARGSGGAEVPPEVKAVYRSWYPDMTEAEMRAAYNATHKNN